MLLVTRKGLLFSQIASALAVTAFLGVPVARAAPLDNPTVGIGIVANFGSGLTGSDAGTVTKTITGSQNSFNSQEDVTSTDGAGVGFGQVSSPSSPNLTLGTYAQATLGTGYFPGYNVYVNSTADATFEFRIDGPSGPPVPIVFIANSSTTAGSSSVSGFNNNTSQSSALFNVDLEGTPVLSLFSQNSSSGSGTPGFTFTGVRDLAPNTVYEVVEQADAQVNVVSSDPGSATAGADFDPYFYIDPTFANASLYSIEIAPGIGNSAPSLSGVPEPATWALMFAGFGGVGGAMRMGRRKSPVAAA